MADEKQKEQTMPSRREERGISPFDERSFSSSSTMLQRFRDEMDRVFESFFTGPSFGRWSMAPFERFGRMIPAVDVWEEDQNVMVRADIPGADPNNIEIYTTEDSLVIRAETKHEEERKEKGYYRSERRYGSFERTIDLPSEVQPEQAKATFKHGVLEVTMPKSRRALERMKKVPVESEEEQMTGSKGGLAKSAPSSKSGKK